MSEKEQQLLHLIKGCENFGLTEKESIDAVNNILDKSISRRTSTITKRDCMIEIFTKLKDTTYDTKEMKCLLLELEETNKLESLRANRLISDQFPHRKDIFHDEDKQIKEMEKLYEKINLINKKFEESKSSVLLGHNSIPDNATIREEFVKCGKEACNLCPHGSYYYAYWKNKPNDDNKKKLKKNYLGTFDPRR